MRVVISGAFLMAALAVLSVTGCQAGQTGSDSGPVSDAALDAAVLDSGTLDGASDGSVPDSGNFDASADASDAAVTDVGPGDAGTDASDSGVTDSGLQDSGFADAGSVDAGPPDEFEKLTAFISSCGVTEPDYGIGGFAEGWAKWSALSGDRSTEARVRYQQYLCVKSAKTCDALKSCLFADADQSKACAGLDIGHKCSGDMLVYCSSGGELQKLDCAAGGSKCVEGAGGGNCVESPCAKPPFNTCVEDVSYACGAYVSGQKTAFDCAYYGMVCDPAAAGMSDMCKGAGADCDSNKFTRTCQDGFHLVLCAAGKVGVRDCRHDSPYSVCYVDKNNYASCGTGYSECKSLNPNDTCVDGVVTYCYFNRKKSLDCKSLGYSGCGTRYSSTLVGTIGYCN